MLLLILLVVLGSTASLSNDEILTCSVCQFTSHYIHLNGESSEGNKANFNKAIEQCKAVKGCENKLTHCELISSLAPMIPNNADYHALSFAFRLLSTQCNLDPESHVLENISLLSINTCPICKLMYTAFEDVNNGIINIGKKDGPILKGLIALFCQFINGNFGNKPAFCDPLREALQPIENGILDSLGPFYNQFGKPFGCPAYQNLTLSCP